MIGRWFSTTIGDWELTWFLGGGSLYRWQFSLLLIYFSLCGKRANFNRCPRLFSCLPRRAFRFLLIKWSTSRLERLGAAGCSQLIFDSACHSFNLLRCFTNIGLTTSFRHKLWDVFSGLILSQKFEVESIVRFFARRNHLELIHHQNCSFGIHNKRFE